MNNQVEKYISDLIDPKPILESKDHKYVWLNILTGEFSNSWDAFPKSFSIEEAISMSKGDEWRLIEYRCLNSESFEFCNLMRLR